MIDDTNGSSELAEALLDVPAKRALPTALRHRDLTDGSFTLDLLARLGERFEFDDIEASTVELEGEPVRAATPNALYEMKRDTVRPQDRADAAALRRTFDLEEE